MNKRRRSDHLEKSVDSGYAWVVLVACFIMYMFSMGCVKSFGILYGELQEVYDAGTGNTVSIGSTATFLQSILSPLANSLSTYTSFKKVTFTGGVLVGLALLFSSLVTDIWMMSITYSLLGGIGLGLTFVPCSTIVNFYFEKRRSFANGVVVSASGVGGFAFPYLYRSLFDEYGLRGGLLVLGGFMMNICVVASLLRQPYKLSTITDAYKEQIQQENEEKQTHKSKEDISVETDLSPPDQDNQTKSKIAIQWFRNVFKNVFKFDWKLLQSTRLNLCILAFSFAMLGYGSVFYMLPAQMGENGLGKHVVVFALSILGICEVFSRIIVGMIVDAKITSPHLIFSFSMLVSGISVVLVPYMTVLMHYCIFAVIIGVFPGSMFTVLPAIIVEDIGLSKLPSVFGLVYFFAAIINGVGHPLSGWLTDVTGKWDTSCYVIGGLLVTSSVLVFMNKMASILRRGRCKENKDPSEIKDIEEIETMLSTDKQ